MKYHITKADGSPVDPDAVYFVLRLDNHSRPDHLACRSALQTYAREVRTVDPGAHQAAQEILDRTRPPLTLRSTIFDRVKKVLCEEFGAHADNVTAEALLVDHLGMDSLDTIEAAMAIEQEFAITVSEEAAERCRTVNDVVDLVFYTLNPSAPFNPR